MKTLLLLSSFFVHTLVVNGFTTPAYMFNFTGPVDTADERDCWSTSLESMNAVTKTCVGTLIKTKEFRSYLDLDVCEFTKKTVLMVETCLVKEFVKVTNCSLKIIKNMIGIFDEGKSMAQQDVEYKFCDGPAPNLMMQ
ncbi:unnamed protein product [Owenia fusiformis]|uniref:Uncharacterized protein n=1 Tax=Owenia fusiformis TaxID=6347 RepID=A0A8S4N020_OWEFU|nr:unnamed protein product [Owenia fusiformis]